MTVYEDIETRLRRAVAVAPSEDGLRWLDERVGRLMAAPAVTRRRGAPTFRTFLRPLALVAAFAVVTGTVGAAMGLLDGVVEGSGPGLRTAWDRAEILGIRQTDAGVTITLERAYADLNQVVVGFTVEGLEAAPTSSAGERAPVEWVADLRDPSGRPADEWATSRLGRGTDVTDLSAVLHAWEGRTAPVAGTWELTVTSVGYGAGSFSDGICTVEATDPACASPGPDSMVDGTWRFTFDLPTPAGTVVSPDVTDTAGPATVTLTELRVTPTMITSRLALRVAGSTVTSWGTASYRLSIRDDSTSYTSDRSYHVTQDPSDQGPNGDENELLTTAGSDQATGIWVIEIMDLWYVSGDGGPETEIRLPGPWTLTVTVP